MSKPRCYQCGKAVLEDSALQIGARYFCSYQCRMEYCQPQSKGDDHE